MTEEAPAEKAPAKRTPAAKAEPPKNIYQLISTISEEAGALAPEAKGGVPFAFRGVDQVVSHLSPLLRKHGVVVVPEVVEQTVTTRELSAAKAITQTALRTRFTFYAPDGTSVSATTAGLAQDYADRSTAQAQSVAFRVALLQVFTLPTTDKEPEQQGEETQKYIQAAAAENAAVAQAAAKAKSGPPEPTVADLKGTIASHLKAQKIEGAAAIKAYGDKYFEVEANPERKVWATRTDKLTELLNHIKKEAAEKAKAVAETGADAATGEVA